MPAAVALETLKIYDERDIVGAVRRVGPRMQAGIRSYADHPLIGEARGIGLIGAVELVRDKATKQSFDPKAGVAAFLVRRAQHHGAILRNMPGDIVAFSPPLIISEAEIDEMMACFGKALDDTWAMVQEKGPRVSASPRAAHGAAAGMPDPIVRFVGIGKTYDGVTRVVDDLNLDIAARRVPDAARARRARARRRR